MLLKQYMLIGFLQLADLIKLLLHWREAKLRHLVLQLQPEHRLEIITHHEVDAIMETKKCAIFFSIVQYFPLFPC